MLMLNNFCINKQLLITISAFQSCVTKFSVAISTYADVVTILYTTSMGSENDVIGCLI